MMGGYLFGNHYSECFLPCTILWGELERWEKWMGCDSRVIEERKIKFYWDSLNQITNYV